MRSYRAFSSSAFPGISDGISKTGNALRDFPVENSSTADEAASISDEEPKKGQAWEWLGNMKNCADYRP